MSALRQQATHTIAGDVEGNQIPPQVGSMPDFERIEGENIDLRLPRFKKICQEVQSRFGFDVKSYQAGAIADILEAKRDVFVIAGTGSGKSLIYQILPYLLKDKIVLIVCPTLALMSDQV